MRNVTEMSTWRIRLNGTALMTIRAPSHMDPAKMAREVLLHGAPDREDVQVTWA